MITFKEFLEEASSTPKDPTPISSNDLMKEVGKGAWNSITKNPLFKEFHSSYKLGWKHGVSRTGHHVVEMYPYMEEVHKQPDGRIRPEFKVIFTVSHFSGKGKVIQAEKWHRPKEPNDAELRHGPSAGWTHVKDWKDN